LAHNGIIVVDDNPANLRLLEDMLLQRGYKVRSFPLGRLALTAAVKDPPDLFLLDINMPEMNGYEVCERLKSTDELSDIPVIFLSALNETQDKVKAFKSGAVDYISKPFEFEEVHARVKTHLKLHELQRILRLQNDTLEEAVAVRTRELGEAMKRLAVLDRSKSDFLNLISHEFRTPLNGILGVGELMFMESLSEEEKNDLRELFEHSRGRLLSILDDALLLTQIDINSEQFGSTPVSLSTVVRRAILSSTEFAESRGIAFTIPTSNLDFVLGDEDLLVRAFHAVLETAVKFSEKGDTVLLSHDVAPGLRTIIIESHGRSIPDGSLAKFFDLFSIGEAITPGGDLGVGPPLACRILSLFGASVRVANLDPPGIQLTVSLKGAAPCP
jgi:two-component system sensor histidine kinase/response regulator